MISIYFAMTYRSYLPRSRKRKAMSGAAPKKKLEESAMISNVAELQLKPAPEKKSKPLSGGELQPVSENKDVQPVPNENHKNHFLRNISNRFQRHLQVIKLTTKQNKKH
ncbi:hypothetical protein ACH3XW_6605 [Acanthocheilonema viteae]